MTLVIFSRSWVQRPRSQTTFSKSAVYWWRHIDWCFTVKDHPVLCVLSWFSEFCCQHVCALTYLFFCVLYFALPFSYSSISWVSGTASGEKILLQCGPTSSFKSFGGLPANLREHRNWSVTWQNALCHFNFLLIEQTVTEIVEF